MCLRGAVRKRGSHQSSSERCDSNEQPSIWQPRLHPGFTVPQGAEETARFWTDGRQTGSWKAPSLTVAVGTTITDRPPHRSVRARLRIRLLRRMSGVEACIGIGVQNSGWRNPPVQDWGKTFPTHLCALTTADQNTLP